MSEPIGNFARLQQAGLPGGGASLVEQRVNGETIGGDRSWPDAIPVGGGWIDSSAFLHSIDGSVDRQKQPIRKIRAGSKGGTG